MRRRPPEVAFRCIVYDSDGEDARGVLGRVFAVDFEGFGQGVGGVIGFFDLAGLDVGGFFEGAAGFDVWR